MKFVKKAIGYLCGLVFVFSTFGFIVLMVEEPSFGKIIFLLFNTAIFGGPFYFWVVKKPTSQKEIASTTEIKTASPYLWKPIPKKKTATWSMKYAYIYDEVKIYVMADFAPNYDSLLFDYPISLVAEPENVYDNKAVALYQNGEKLGYLYKGTLQDMANDFIKAGLDVDAELVSHNRSENKIIVKLLFPYKDASTARSIKTVRLTGNANNDMQDNISMCDPGDSVSVEYDYDKEKFLVLSDGLEIGYLTDSASEYVVDEEINAIIESIEENDNGKYVVKIAIKT